MTDYEEAYQRNEAACGEPFPEIVSFFAKFAVPAANVLDLGCGQGRDALLIAAHGHRVHGIDASATGIRQLLEKAGAAGLAVTGEVADLRQYQPQRAAYDVVVMDRVIHMMGDAANKRQLLTGAKLATRAGGTILIADTPSNMALIEAAFAPPALWQSLFRRRGFRFYRKAIED